MFRFMLVSACVAIVASQQQQYHQNPQTAAIISEQRYQTGDGQFGAAYTQEDGTDFKEETDADGTRHGSYSYIDPTGQKRTISYTAGKNGFQASGDHLPVAPPAPAHAAPQQPQQQYRSQAAPQQYQQQQYNGDSSDQFDDGQYDPRHNDPSFSTGNNNNHFVAAPTHAPAAPLRQQQQYQQPQQQQYQQPQQPQYNPQPNYNHVPQYTTTPNPHRFQPPGKLSLNRTPDGYSYSFNKV